MGRPLPPNSGIEHNWEKYYELHPTDVFVEVGGYFGLYVAYAAPRCSQVFVLEPHPWHLPRVYDAVKAFQNVHVIQKGISSKKGMSTFITKSNSDKQDNSAQLVDFASESRRSSNDDTRFQVETDTLEGILDSFNIPSVDLIGVDCENCEVELVRGAGRWSLGHLVKHWAVGAYHREENHKIISEILTPQGYTCRYEEGVLYGD